MDLLIEVVKLATALAALVAALLKIESESEADGSNVQENEKGRDAR